MAIINITNKKKLKELISDVSDNIIEVTKAYTIKKNWSLLQENLLYSDNRIIGKKLEKIIGQDYFLKLKLSIDNNQEKMLPVHLEKQWFVDTIFISDTRYYFRVKIIDDYYINLSKKDRFLNLFENIATGVAIYKVNNNGESAKDYIIQEYNKMSCKKAGKRKEEIIGKSIADIVEGIEDTGLIEVFKEVYETGIPQKLKVTKFEDKYWFENSVYKLPSGEIVASYTDMTKVMEANEQLLKSEKRLYEYMEKAPYGVFIASESGGYLEVNKKAVDITGYTRKELLSMNLMELIYSKDQETAKQHFSSVKLLGESIGNLRFITKKGEIRSWSVKAITLSSNRFLGFVEDITDFLNLQQNMLDSEERFRELFEKAPLGYQSLDIEGYVIDVNQQWLDLLGYKKDEVIGKWFGEFLTENGKDLFKKNFPRFKKLGKIQTVLEMTDKRGMPHYIDFYGHIGRDDQMNFKQTHCILKDVTSENKIQQEIKESREILATAESITHVGSFKHKITSKETNWSDEFYRILGYKPEEIEANMTFFKKQISNEEQLKFEKLYNAAIDNNESFEMEFKIIRKDGVKRWVDMKGSVRIEEKEKEIEIVGSLSDIHDRKKIEENLKSNIETLKQAEQLAKFGYFNEEKMKTKTFKSEGIANILEIDRNLFDSYYLVRDYVIKEDYERYINFLQLMTKTKKNIEIHFTVKTAKENIKHFYGIAKSNFNEKKQLERTIGVIIDETKEIVQEKEKLLFEKKLREQQNLKAIGTLASGIAHEINNPINGIMNYGQIILDDNPNDENLVLYSSEIIRESNRVAKIVKNLLQFSRQDNQQYGDVLVNDIINQTLLLIKTVIRHDHIKLILDLKENLPMIYCKDQQIKQVILNLITNAKDALNIRYPKTDLKKVMRISTIKQIIDNNEYIRIAVKDAGNGIDEKVKHKIFDPFFTTKNKEDGTGLGLSISYGIISDHNGKLSFDSKIGEGTTFYIDLLTTENIGKE